MSAYFAYRYYTAKQNDVRGEENGRNREEAYLQAQCSKWGKCTEAHYIFGAITNVYSNLYASCKERKESKASKWYHPDKALTLLMLQIKHDQSFLESSVKETVWNDSFLF